MELKTGWHENIENDAYHKMEFAVGSTTLNETLRSPAHAKYWRENQKESKHERFGSIVHAALLQPHIFARYRVIQQCDRRTKEGKFIYAQFMDSLLDGDKMISEDEYQKVRAIQDAVLSHPTFQKIFSGGVAESTGIYDDGSGIPMKIRPDYRSELLPDIKTTDDARLRSFDRQILENGYDVQAAYYQDVANLIAGRKQFESSLWVVIEVSPPFCVAFYEVSREWIELGREKYKRALCEFIKAKLTGVHPGYPEEILQAVPPAYAQFY